MAPYRIRWTMRALRRLDEIGAHIAKDDPAAAERVVARIAIAVENLSMHSEMGRPGRLKETRELVLADIPYIIPYRVRASQVEILTVIHTAQRWPLKL